jgi:hypothetical protein
MESSDSDMKDQDAGFDDDPEADPGEELEAVMERADRPLGTESFGTTAEEQVRGETLDQRLSEERREGQRDQAPVEDAVVIEDADEPDEEAELVGDASMEHDPFTAPEEAAVHVQEDRSRDN